MTEPVSAADLAAVEAQLGRSPRSVVAVAHRCPCGLPDVIATAPRLDDGSPFPTFLYLTCPRAAAAVGSVESTGRMREMTEQLAVDPELASAYKVAADDYRARRDAVGQLDAPLPGGMPERVKCLHALVAHSLVAGDGVNPFGDQVLAEIGQWWTAGPCVGQ